MLDILIVCLLTGAIVLIIALLLRQPNTSFLESVIRQVSQNNRQDVRDHLDAQHKLLSCQLDGLTNQTQTLNDRLERQFVELRQMLVEDTRLAREENARGQQQATKLLTLSLGEVRQQLTSFSQQQSDQLCAFGQQQTEHLAGIDKQVQILHQVLSEDARKARQELTQSLQHVSKTLDFRMNDLTLRTDQRLGEMRTTLEQQLQVIQTENAGKLDLIRETVDEKLQSTLHQRLDSSFQRVSERLEQVQRGLGEMQHLAIGVGDLKRVLSNVKNRGGWGEIQLESILEQTLTQDQYARNVQVDHKTAYRVDFALKLPGRHQHDQHPVWLPIDAKFPREDYERLIDAQDQGDQESMRVNAAQLEKTIRSQARSIAEKYISPPQTTDFAVMFLPTEGLYAETLRRPGLVDTLQREHRIVLAGPTTLTALLNSLQVGFRTLAIEKYSSEVWALLGVVKNEFTKFASLLEKAEKQIGSVGRSLGDASRKSRTIERRLRNVESVPSELSESVMETLVIDDENES